MLDSQNRVRATVRVRVFVRVRLGVRQRVLPQGHIGATWRIRLNFVSFSPLESTIEMQMDRFSRFCTAYGRKCLYFTMGDPVHQNCPFPLKIWTSHVTRDAFGPSPLPSNRHHRSNGDCLEGKGENYQVCYVQYCVQQLCTVQCTHI